LEACSGIPLRRVEAISSSSFSLIDSYMLFEAPFSSLTFCSPRLAASAAPASRSGPGKSTPADDRCKVVAENGGDLD
jgi:hypothetical protein